MQEMVDAIRATVELAVRQGSTQARIALQPEELGGIRIHLSQTAEGLVARLVGETPAAAQALAEGHAELHRSLSSLGMPLLRMDIGSYSQPDARPREDRFAARPEESGSERSTVADEEVEGPEALVSPDHTQRASVLVGGSLVDVLA
jgi:flagellar hook-length control protein FliK